MKIMPGRGLESRSARLLRRLWASLKAPHPFQNCMALAAEYEVHLPAYLLFQAYTAWQSALQPVWNERRARFQLRFYPGRYLSALGHAFRALGPWNRRVFHRVSNPGLSSGPRVLHVIPSLLLGGSQKVVFDLIERLGSAYRMRILTGALPQWGRYHGLDISVCSSAEAMAKQLREWPPEIIHLHYLGMEPFTQAFLDALARTPEVTAPILENNNMPIPALIHPHIKHYVYVSEYALKLQPLPTAPNSVIYPGIELDEWQPRGPRPAGLPLTVGTVYRLAHEKLNLASLEPFIQIARRLPQARMLIVGEGLLLPHFVRRAKEAGVRHQFQFEGRVPYRLLPAYYDRFDLFLAPVHEESFGVVVPYALCKGIPVLAYRVGALPEILGAEGQFFNGPEEMAERAVRLLLNSDESKTSAQTLQARAQRFNLETMTSAYAQIYSRLSTPKGVPPWKLVPPQPGIL